jgi:LuxR family maltose regulon positive regulatory protein
LFAELLKKRLAADQDAAILHQRAADWFAANGRFDEAVRHLMGGGPTSFAEERLEVWGEALIKLGEVELLRRWTGAFPEKVRSPFLGVHAAWAAVLSGRAEEVERWAAHSERNLPPPGETRAKVEQNLAASRAFAAQSLGSLERAVKLSEATLAGPLNPEIRAALQLNAGQSLRRLGEYERALQMLADAAQGGFDTGHIYLAFGALFHRTACLRVLGRLQAALRTIDEMEKLRAQERRGGYLALAGGEVERAQASWLLGDQEAALAAARRAIVDLEVVTEPWDLVYVRAILTRVLASSGELDEAEAMLDETRLPSRANDRCRVEFPMQTARAELSLARGDLERARTLLGGGDAPDVETAFDRRFLEARIAFAKGEPIDRAAAAERAESETRGRLMHTAAWAALLAASRRDAVSMADARRLAERTGMQRWCMMFELSQPAPQPVRPAQVEPMVETLTQRELEVLGLIAEGLSNQDAASKLFVSVGTVKTHVHKILAKLAADNRTEAVHKARSLGLIR